MFKAFDNLIIYSYICSATAASCYPEYISSSKRNKQLTIMANRCKNCADRDNCDLETKRANHWGEDCFGDFYYESNDNDDDYDCNCCIGGFSK